MEKEKNVWGKIKSRLATDEVFYETEIQANRLGTIVMTASGIILAIVLALNGAGIFRMSQSLVMGPIIQGIIESAAVIAICLIFRFRKWWLKYLLVIGMVVVFARLDGIFTHRAVIIMAVPVIFSSRYFSRRLTIFSAALSAGAFLISLIWGTVYGMFDLNIVTVEEGTVMTSGGGYLDQAVLDTGFDRGGMIGDAVLFSYIPKLCIFAVISVIAVNIAGRGRRMVLSQHEKDMESARIESELELAARIQSDMLKKDFPAFPEYKEFDVFASMTPAKEVGGDFYDFFKVDEKHICFVIADVSGKGIPAALFMASAMNIIKAAALPGLLPEEILAQVNERICENNKDEMFVTAWLGILDIKSGQMRAANAGHEYPFICSGGSFEILKDKHGFVLGGLPESKYTGYDLHMKPGSILFLYTDGLTDTENKDKEFFGVDRCLEALNKMPSASPKELVEGLQKEAADFAAGEPRFDDITMMCIKFSGENEAFQIKAAAQMQNAEQLVEFAGKHLTEAGFKSEFCNKINIVIDEIFSNIVKYAYTDTPGDVVMDLEVLAGGACRLTFTDTGKAFNPLEAPEPDTSFSAEERSAGGLGILMVKKLTDDVSYEYKDDKNILTVYKKGDNYA